MKRNYGTGEWMTYAFSPIVQSMGGDLIDRQTWKAEGTLNGKASVEALTMIADWQKKGWVVPAEAGDAAFYGDKTAALSWIANWGVKPGREGLGDDLVIIPLPDFGYGPKTALGSWCWTITKDAKDPAQAGKLIESLMSSETIKGMYEAGNYPPGIYSALSVTPNYAPGGALELYQQQLDTIAVPRPVYPGYPVISSAFSQAMQDVLDGADPQEALDKAAKKVDQDIEDNGGYPPFGG
jgi:multiple sugar transport system substrate-binding protein